MGGGSWCWALIWRYVKSWRGGWDVYGVGAVDGGRIGRHGCGVADGGIVAGRWRRRATCGEVECYAGDDGNADANCGEK